MSDFKYLSVVEDSNTPVKEVQPKYRTLDPIYDDKNHSLIEALHGTSSELAAQHYLYDNPREFMVYVRVYLPEQKYTTYKEQLMYRNPAIQSSIKEAQSS